MKKPSLIFALLMKSAMNKTIEEHYKENFNKLVGFYRLKCGDEWSAQDVVQEAYARALKYFENFNPETNEFQAWFSKIINNSFRDFKRAEKGVSTEQYEDEYVEGFSCTMYSDQVMKEIYELIDTKSLAAIEILNLHFKNEYTVNDISAVTEHTRHAAYKTISRFKQELKDLYG